MKITFVTYHNWDTKRHGGFHQFAKYAAEKGNEVVFFSFSRPYYSALKHEERLNAKVLKQLSKGVKYKVNEVSLYNVTWPTLALPGNIRKFFSDSLNVWLMTHSLKPFRYFQKKWLEGTDCFVFESCDAVYLVDIIMKYNPTATIIYRPSDPIADLPSERYLIAGEERMLKYADKVILVNEESRDLYRLKFKDTYDDKKAIVIPNGVSLSAYSKKYDCPEVIKDKKVALFAGVFEVNWELIIYAATHLQNVTFVIITPNEIAKKYLERVKKIDNILYIPGILPDIIPHWVTNSNVIIQPYPDNNSFSKRLGLSLTAQHYKAMAANKPIIAYMLNKSLEKYGLFITDTFVQFVKKVEENIEKKDFHYNYDLKNNDWNLLCARFLKEICL